MTTLNELIAALQQLVTDGTPGDTWVRTDEYYGPGPHPIIEMDHGVVEVMTPYYPPEDQ